MSLTPSLVAGVLLAGALSAGAACDQPGGGGGGSGQACASSAACPTGTSCTTEAGVCNAPPGCDPATGVACPAVCYGTCEPAGSGGGGSSCRTDSVCRLFSDYCTGCDCRALGVNDPDPSATARACSASSTPAKAGPRSA